MPKRKLRIAERSAVSVMGVCERCNSQFKSTKPGLVEAEQEVTAAFNAHKCKLMDSSQNALRIVREATEDK